MTLADQWTEFSKEFVPANAPPVQLTETRRAYYAGAAAFFSTIYHSMDEGAEATDADVTKLAAMHQELIDFGLLVGDGKA